MDPVRVGNEATLRAAIVHVSSQASKESRRGEFLGKFFVLHESFGRRSEVKFIGLYGTVIFIAIRDLSCRGESNLWSDVWPATYRVVCLSILLEGGATVSNNFTKRRQNGFKIGTRETFATHLR